MTIGAGYSILVANGTDCETHYIGQVNSLQNQFEKNRIVSSTENNEVKLKIQFMELTQLIEDLRIPDLPPQAPKNFFDITGIRNKEVINSRVLSYFFKANEEHGFGTLFYDSLLDLIEKKKHEHIPVVNLNYFNGEFTVTEEEQTTNVGEKEDQKKRIDLVLKGEDWAIIIENKLYHDVINPLHTYWDHIEADHKIGIILSLFDVSKSKRSALGGTISYINITHQEFISTVSKRFNFTSEHNEISLFYLKEYFKTIETHYSTNRNTPIMNKIINELISQKKRIGDLLQTIKEADDFIIRTIEKIFLEKGFENSNGLGNPSKVFFTSADVNGIFFSTNTKDLLTKNILQIHLAAFTPMVNDKMVDNMKQIAKTCVENIDLFAIGTYAGKDHTHITIYTNKNFLSKEDQFDVKFRGLLDELFFKKDGIIDQIKFEIK